jgi:hypothetical protein
MRPLPLQRQSPCLLPGQEADQTDGQGEKHALSAAPLEEPQRTRVPSTESLRIKTAGDVAEGVRPRYRARISTAYDSSCRTLVDPPSPSVRGGLSGNEDNGTPTSVVGIEDGVRVSSRMLERLAMLESVFRIATQVRKIESARSA